MTVLMEEEMIEHAFEPSGLVCKMEILTAEGAETQFFPTCFAYVGMIPAQFAYRADGLN